MSTLKARLDLCAYQGALSTADLAVWFDLSYQTVRSYRRGTTPYDARAKQIEQWLTWLERAIDTDPRFPIPLLIRAPDRKSYVKAVRDGYTNFL